MRPINNTHIATAPDEQKQEKQHCDTIEKRLSQVQGSLF